MDFKGLQPYNKYLENDDDYMAGNVLQAHVFVHYHRQVRSPFHSFFVCGGLYRVYLFLSTQGWVTEDHTIVLLDDELDENGKPSNQQQGVNYLSHMLRFSNLLAALSIIWPIIYCRTKKCKKSINSVVQTQKINEIMSRQEFRGALLCVTTKKTISDEN